MKFVPKRKERLTRKFWEYSSCGWTRELRLRQLKCLLSPKIWPSRTAKVFNHLMNCCSLHNIVLMPTEKSGGSLQRAHKLQALGHGLTSNLEVCAAGADHENREEQHRHQQSQSKPFPFVSPLSSAVWIICVFRGNVSISLSWSALGLSTVCSYPLRHSAPAPRPLFSPLPSCSLSVGIIARKRRAHIQAECDPCVL